MFDTAINTYLKAKTSPSHTYLFIDFIVPNYILNIHIFLISKILLLDSFKFLSIQLYFNNRKLFTLIYVFKFRN